MVEPCDICGDVGVHEAIITCCECKASREHLYCMSVVRTEVPPFWTCQECEHKQLISPFSVEEQKPEASTKKVLSVPEKSVRFLEGPTRPPLASRFQFKEKRVDTGRTQYLSCAEATKLSSGSKKTLRTPFRSMHGSPKSLPSPRERTTLHERSKSLVPELKPSASPNAFSNKCDAATPSMKSPESVRTPIVSPSRERAAKFEPRQQQPQSTGLKEKVVMSFQNKGGATRSSKPHIRTKTLAELLQQERPIEVKPDSHKLLVQESSGPKAEKPVMSSQNRGDDATPSVKPSMPSTTKRKFTETEMTISRIEAVPPIKVADVGREIVIAKSPKEPEKPENNSVKIEAVPLIKVADGCREIVMAKSPKEPEKPETNTGGNNHGDVEAQSSDAGKPNLTSGIPGSEGNSPSLPTCISYWTGVLFLPDRAEKFDGAFKAHLPSRAHYKVYQMVKKMPENLYFQLVPRHEIWMRIFPHSSPDRDDIGLYFFPKFKQRSENDIYINDLLCKENLVMRSSVEGRVLLVFSSRLLPSHSQEFKGSYFLWGVFCCPKVLMKAPKPLLERNCEPYDDAPPGFKRICEPYDDVPPGFKKIRKT